MLTKLEDQVLMTVWKFRGDAYGVNVYRHLETITEKKVAVGVVYFTLDRLAQRGYLRMHKGEPTAVRGGMRKKFYRITRKGIGALAESKAVHDRIWDAYDDLQAVAGEPS